MKSNRQSVVLLTLALLSPWTCAGFSGPTSRPKGPSVSHRSAPGKPGDGKFVFTLSDGNFTEAAKADIIGEGPLFVEFYAPWCSHCKALTPIWSELAAVLRGQVRVGALDISINPLVAEKLHIAAFPTLLFLVRGRIYRYESEGARTLSKLKRFALGGYHNADWSELPSDIADGQELANSEHPPLWLMVQYATYQIVFGTFYFWKRAKVPSVVTFFLGVMVGGFLTVVVTKAATNRHLAELEDELLDQIEAFDQQRDDLFARGKKKGKEA